MIKCLLCVVGGVLVGMLLYSLGVPDPIPPIVVGVASGVMAMEVRHE